MSDVLVTEKNGETTMTETKWEPVKGNMMSKWTDDVDPTCPLPEYPRPQMVRNDWVNLNGLWEYAVVPKEKEWVSKFHNQILVPFAIESSLSGVGRLVQPEEHLWYKRTINLPEGWDKKRTILHFGAVDWKTHVYVNGKEVGKHVGGYMPFSFDITDYLVDGENELVVKVWDPTDKGWQNRGKQVLKAHSIFYTPTTGIWQTVWMESVSKTYIKDFKLTPDIDTSELKAKVNIEGSDAVSLKLTALDKEGKVVATKTATKGELDKELVLEIKDPTLWSPENPYLYDLKMELTQGSKVVDNVESYFGMRKFHIMRDDRGRNRLALNNKITFQSGPLDQGYWPDGVMTAPTDEALKFDVQAAKDLGFNMIRKAIKVEPARWYHHCDKLGMIVWQDMISGSRNFDKHFIADVALSFFFKHVRMRDDTSDTVYKITRRCKESRDQFQDELGEMLHMLYNCPSIGLWVPFNEGWGQFDSNRIGRWMREIDSTRPIDNASGFWDQGEGDIQSIHTYNQKLKTPKMKHDRVFTVSEYGGYGLEIKDRVWKNDIGVFRIYKMYKTPEEFEKAYVDLHRNELMPLKEEGLSGAVYTQITDVEKELNGFYTYDREVLKINAKTVYDINQELYNL